jgi:hypothetical protein
MPRTPPSVDAGYVRVPPRAGQRGQNHRNRGRASRTLRSMLNLPSATRDDGHRFSGRRACMVGPANGSGVAVLTLFASGTNEVACVARHWTNSLSRSGPARGGPRDERPADAGPRTASERRRVRRPVHPDNWTQQPGRERPPALWRGNQDRGQPRGVAHAPAASSSRLLPSSEHPTAQSAARRAIR